MAGEETLVGGRKEGTQEGKVADGMCYKANYHGRHLGLSPVREILAACVELRPWLFHPRAGGIVLFICLTAALGVGLWALTDSLA